jgi:hypothetical protein
MLSKIYVKTNLIKLKPRPQRRPTIFFTSVYEFAGPNLLKSMFVGD